MLKKILNWVVSVAGFLLLIALLLISLNNSLHFMDEFVAKIPGLVTYIQNYGALTIVAALVVVNLVGKSIIKIVMLVLFLILVAFYIFSSVFPAEFVKLFGIGG